MKRTMRFISLPSLSECGGVDSDDDSQSSSSSYRGKVTGQSVSDTTICSFDSLLDDDISNKLSKLSHDYSCDTWIELIGDYNQDSLTISDYSETECSYSPSTDAENDDDEKDNERYMKTLLYELENNVLAPSTLLI